MRCISIIWVLLIVLGSCSLLEQNDFIETENVGLIGDEQIIYSAFKTGIDNYRIEFRAVLGSDTSKVFDFYINDAIYTKEKTFDFKMLRDTLFVLTPFQACRMFHETKNEGIVVVTSSLEMKACQD
ncbi:MAG: hypothetical protein WKF87_03985 [Chryseolinea sp.]